MLTGRLVRNLARRGAYWKPSPSRLRLTQDRSGAGPPIRADLGVSTKRPRLSRQATEWCSGWSMQIRHAPAPLGRLRSAMSDSVEVAPIDAQPIDVKVSSWKIYGASNGLVSACEK